MTAFKPLVIGPHQVWPPVVLAPMAGITNTAYRQVCREHGAGLYVCEMITTRALLVRNPKTMRMVTFGALEQPRSLQLYGVDPDITAQAVAMVVRDNLADHIDLNFGCPVPKVTRRGGGSALPYRRRLFGNIVRRAVEAAGDIPVTVKLRKGIDDDHLTHLDAGRIAAESGAAAVALHARTAAQGYSGQADWSAIAELKNHVSGIPVLGNGDIWEAEDAIRMMTETGCDGVVVGRGCLGRPWLFADLAAAFDGRPERARPTLGQVAVTMRRHAGLLVQWQDESEPPIGREAAERYGCADFRKHIAWYTKGYPVGGELRKALAMVSSLAELDDLLGKLDADAPFPESELGVPRGRTAAPPRIVLPEGWLSDPESDEVPEGAELETSGG